MKILHTSDVHGRFDELRKLMREVQFDAWIDTGDLLPNTRFGMPRMGGGGLQFWSKLQEDTQSQIVGGEQFKKFANVLGERPALFVQGNHDFIEVGPRVNFGDQITHELSYEWGHKIISGFAGVPPINGVWWGEFPETELYTRAQSSLFYQPDILCAHVPVHGFLDWFPNYRGTIINIGSTGFRRAIGDTLHRPKLILHGHCHEQSGEEAEIAGIRIFNSAETIRIFDTENI